MATAIMDCTQLEMLTLERVKYFSRQLLTADDMTTDQEYFRIKLRRHNRYLHGWGVVCGMGVTVAPTNTLPWQVQIGAGYALGPYGDEIYIPEPVFLDLEQCGPGAETDPCDPGLLLRGNRATGESTLFIAVRYEECYSRPVRVMPGGCGCEDTVCETSRIRDSFQIDCLEELPPSHQPGPAGPSICDLLTGRAIAQCPPCPTDPWIVLARVTLPASGAPLAQTQIDTFVRRQLFSTAAIQDQVIRCCCTGTDRRPARVTSINPANGVVFTNANTIPPAVLITFSKNLQPATVNTNTVQVLRITPGAPSVVLQGNVTYDDGQRLARFTPAQAFTVPAVYQVTVVGSGPSAIVDVDNLALDGNDDGQPGGNFLSQFTVQLTQPTPTPTTPAPALTGTVQGPSPIPTVGAGRLTSLGELRIIISGGSAGRRITSNFQVFLNIPIQATGASDLAQLTPGTGTPVSGAVSGNAYTFSNVPIDEPGPGNNLVLRISNMRGDTANLGGGTVPGNVVAFVSVTSVPAIPLTNPQQVIANVQAG